MHGLFWRLDPVMPLVSLLLAALFCLPAFATTAASNTTPLTTEAERSNFVRTGRYAEVAALCAAFAARYPDAVRCQNFGTTPEGRPMHLLVVSRTGVLDPMQAQARDLPVLLVQGGIHAGEIDGKDAGFLLLRRLLDGQAAPAALEKLVLLFVPVFNVDGHERFGPWNRPNQRGPEEMGRRATAQNLNLNRDYMKAAALEMHAMLRLVNTWDPIVVMDLHVTNGAKFEHDVSINAEPVNTGDPQLRSTGRAIRDGIIERLTKQGSLPLTFYPSFVEEDNPASGFVDSAWPPRYSHSYFQLRNRIGLLVETHSWKDYATRVRITRNTVLNLVELAARDGKRWLRAAHEADQRATALGGKPVTLEYQNTDRRRTIDFRGYAYTRTPSDISGALMTRYEEDTPQLWKLPLRDEIVPKLSVAAPQAGYLIPPAFVPMLRQKLEVHGIKFQPIAQPVSRAPVQTWRATQIKFAATSVEGKQRLTATGDWQQTRMDLPMGTLFVPIAQPKARLVIALLEPQAPDSLLAWGELNTAFEQKEYMEPYVAEQIAREMLAHNPALKAAFEQRLRTDPQFAQSPKARLDFFYQRHPAYDERLNLYPVLRVNTVPSLLPVP